VRVLRFCVPGAALVAVVVAAVMGGRQPSSEAAAELRPPKEIRALHVSQRAAAARLGSGKAVELAFAGDVHFESPIAEELSANPRDVLHSIRPVLSGADLAIVNLETAITTRGAPAAKTYVFRAPPDAFKALTAGGVDAASMANNHGMDYGETGLRDSIAAARKARFPVIGIGLDAEQAYRPYRAVVKGQRIAVLAATQVIDDHLISAWSADPNAPGWPRRRTCHGCCERYARRGRPRTRSWCSCTGASSSSHARPRTSGRSRSSSSARAPTSSSARTPTVCSGRDA